MIRKILIILILLIVFIITGYFIYKGYLLYYYKIDIMPNLVDNFEASKNKIVTIEHKNDIINNGSFKNIMYPKLNNDFVFKGDYKELEGYDYETYYLYGENKTTYSAIFKVGTYDYTMYKLLTMTNRDIPTFAYDFRGTNDKKLLDKYNIENDIDLFEYIFAHYSDNNISIFTNRDTIRVNYLIKALAKSILPAAKIYIINGDYSGYIYIMENENYYEVHLINNDKICWFGFKNGKNNEYFDLDVIKTFIGNVVIE